MNAGQGTGAEDKKAQLSFSTSSPFSYLLLQPSPHPQENSTSPATPTPRGVMQGSRALTCLGSALHPVVRNTHTHTHCDHLLGPKFSLFVSDRGHLEISNKHSWSQSFPLPSSPLPEKQSPTQNEAGILWAHGWRPTALRQHTLMESILVSPNSGWRHLRHQPDLRPERD